MSKGKSKRTRQYRGPSQKAELLRQHHVDKVPISDLCDQWESLKASLGPGPADGQRDRSPELRKTGRQRRPMISELKLDLSGSVVLTSRLHEPMLRA